MTLFGVTQNYYSVTISEYRGEYTRTETAGTFVGTIQPLTGKETELLNVGREDLGKVKVYSSTQLNVSTEETENSGDIVVYSGKKWEIIQALDYQNNLIPHYKYIAEYKEEV
jgi:hypothetical protein